MVKTKICCRCKKVRPLSQFIKRKDTRDGLTYYCKICHQKVNFIYINRVRQKDWPGYLKKVREYRRTYGGFYGSLKYRKYKLSFSREEFVKWNQGQERKCFYCDIPEEIMLKDDNFSLMKGQLKMYRLTIDRKNNNGQYSLDNIVLACNVCNSTKGSFFEYKEFKKMAMEYIKPKWNIEHE